MNGRPRKDRNLFSNENRSGCVHSWQRVRTRSMIMLSILSVYLVLQMIHSISENEDKGLSYTIMAE